MIKLFNTRNDIILKRIEQLTHEMNKCTDNFISWRYKVCIERMWKIYGKGRKKK